MTEKKETLVTIVIPSWNNPEYLEGALNSLVRNQGTPGMMRIIVVNNGEEHSCDWVKHPQITVLNAGQNLGWEGGIDYGLKHTKSPFVVFMNDDAYVPPTSRLWLNRLLQHFNDPRVAAVGPSSNVVMGLQNIFVDAPFSQIDAKFLIGFCVVHRREMFEQIGGMDLELPSGDDLDWSIRYRDAGYKLLIDRDVFVYHHGFKTGQRIMGDHQTAGGWNSYEMQERTNLALIKKHGLKKWWDTMKGAYLSIDINTSRDIPDIEGNVIRGLIKEQEKLILDLGCGPRKTLPRATGIDYVKKGERILTLDGSEISAADVEADVSKGLPFDENSVDVIIARHILEHMIDPIFVLSYWIEKLKPGGRLILALPNEDWHATIPMNSEHVHAYNPVSAMNLLTAFKLKNIKMIDSGNQISFIAVGEKP